MRSGSYYDQQISAMTGHDRVSRESTLSHDHDRSSGVHSMTRSSVNSESSSLDTTRSWRDQKHEILRLAEQRRSISMLEDEDSDSEDERSSVLTSSRAQSMSRVSAAGQSSETLRRAGSVGSVTSSLSRRSRAARTERYYHRKSKDEESLEGREDFVSQEIASVASPYIHTASVVSQSAHSSTNRSLSADTTHPLITTPPPPPPRDPRLKTHQLVSQMRARPVSYSFEHLRAPPPNLQRPSSQNSHVSNTNHVSNHEARGSNVSLPPRRPSSQMSEQQMGIHRVSNGHTVVSPDHGHRDSKASSLR